MLPSMPKPSPFLSAIRLWGVRYINSTRLAADSWMTEYSSLGREQRHAILQNAILPAVCLPSAALANSEGPIAWPANLFMRELSRHKGSISASLLVREDLSALLKSKDICGALPVLAGAVGNSDSALRSQLQYADKVMQAYLQTSLLCYDSMSLRRITFDSSSGKLLEKIAQGESVHRVRSLSELKRRLHDGKRCFGLFHPALPEDPLVFIHVGLTSELSPSLSSLDVKKCEDAPTHAIFYSVNSPHSGLRGLDIASLLIKEVVRELQGTFPSLHTFSTLSPIPKFMHWLKEKAKGDSPFDLPTQQLENIKNVLSIYREFCPDASLSFSDQNSSASALLKDLLIILTDKELLWMRRQELAKALQPVMTWLGAHYLAQELVTLKGQTLPLDDVARFHLRNGATLHRINWMGNVSQNGIETSSTMMVNYLYDLPSLEKNAARFGLPDWTPPLGSEVESILSTK